MYVKNEDWQSKEHNYISYPEWVKWSTIDFKMKQANSKSCALINGWLLILVIVPFFWKGEGCLEDMANMPLCC